MIKLLKGETWAAPRSPVHLTNALVGSRLSYGHEAFITTTDSLWMDLEQAELAALKEALDCRDMPSMISFTSKLDGCPYERKATSRVPTTSLCLHNAKHYQGSSRNGLSPCLLHSEWQAGPNTPWAVLDHSSPPHPDGWHLGTEPYQLWRGFFHPASYRLTVCHSLGDGLTGGKILVTQPGNTSYGTNEGAVGKPHSDLYGRLCPRDWRSVVRPCNPRREDKYTLQTALWNQHYSLLSCTIVSDLLNPPLGVAILYDSKSTLQALAVGGTKYHGDLQAEILFPAHQLIPKVSDVFLTWLSTHAGIRGNEIAEKEAKEAAKGGTAVDFKLSFTEKKSTANTTARIVREEVLKQRC